MSFISGWLVLLGLVALAVGIAYAIRHSPKPQPAGPAVQVVKTTSRSSSGHGHGSGGSSLGKIALTLVAIAAAIIIIVNIIPITEWIVDTFLHQAFGDKIVQPSTMVVTQPPVTTAAPVATATTRAEDARMQRDIESTTYTISIVDGVRSDWIRIPEGYTVWYTADGLAKGKSSMGMQCSAALDSPPPDASGPEYWCNPSNMQARWIRPYIFDHEETSVLFNYWFCLKPVVSTCQNKGVHSKAVHAFSFI